MKCSKLILLLLNISIACKQAIEIMAKDIPRNLDCSMGIYAVPNDENGNPHNQDQFAKNILQKVYGYTQLDNLHAHYYGLSGEPGITIATYTGLFTPCNNFHLRTNSDGDCIGSGITAYTDYVDQRICLISSQCGVGKPPECDPKKECCEGKGKCCNPDLECCEEDKGGAHCGGADEVGG